MQTVILLHLCGIRARLIFCIVDNVWISSTMLMKQANGFPFRSDIDYFLIHYSLSCLFVSGMGRGSSHGGCIGVTLDKADTPRRHFYLTRLTKLMHPPRRYTVAPTPALLFETLDKADSYGPIHPRRHFYKSYLRRLTKPIHPPRRYIHAVTFI